MSNLFTIILTTSIWCLGLRIATNEGMVFNYLRKAAELKKSVIYEPIILCEWCMPSIHSIFGYGFSLLCGFIPFAFKWEYVFMYPIIVMGSSYLTGMCWMLYELIYSATKYFINAEKLKYFDIKDRKEKHNRSLVKQTNHD